MKKILFALAALMLFAASSEAAGLPVKMGITYVKAPLNVPSIVAKYNKTFEKAFPGVALSFPELTEGPKQTAALAAGEIGIASCLGATSALLAASEGLDVKIIGIYSRAPKFPNSPVETTFQPSQPRTASSAMRRDTLIILG